MSGVACHHIPSTTHIFGRLHAWQVIIVLGQDTQSDNDGRGMLSSPLNCTHINTSSGMACHHIRLTICAVRQHRRYLDIFALGHHLQLDNVGYGNLS